MKTAASVLLTILATTSGAFAGSAIAPDQAVDISRALVDEVSSYSRLNPEAPGAIPAWASPELIIESPILVHTYPELEPCYYLVPIKHTDMGDRSAIWLAADDGRVQVYGTLGHSKQYDTTRELASQQALSHLGLSIAPDDFLCISAHDKNLYWYARASKDNKAHNAFVNLNESDDVKSKLPDPGRLQSLPPLPGQEHGSSEPPGGSWDNVTIRTEYPRKYPDSYDIFRVPYHVQETDYNCGPAAEQMVFDYWGPYIDQTDIAHVVDCVGPWGTGGEGMRRGGHFSLISTAVQDSSLHGFDERPLGYASVEHWWHTAPDYSTRYSDLKELVSSNYPVLLITWYDYDHDTGHFRVVKGYDDNTDVFIVHDPWMTDGPNIHFDQEYLVDDLWVCANRWGLFMAPWSISMAAPECVLPNEVFEVGAQVYYPGPHPFEGRNPASCSTASIQVPAGFDLAGGENATKSLSGISSTGSADSVSWQVVAGSDIGTGSFEVLAKGLISDYWYQQGNYSDSLGGEASRVVSIVEPVQLTGHSNSEITGNGDTLIDPGEEHDLTVSLHNLGPDLTSVAGTISADDPGVSITVDQAYFGDIISGDSAWSYTPYRFSLAGACSTDAVKFELDWTADGYAGSGIFYVGVSDTLDVSRWGHHKNSADYGDQWHLSEERNHTPGGRLSWRCGNETAGEYDPLLDAILETESFSIPEGAPVILSFWHWLDAENANSTVAWDGALIEISVDGGQWQQVTPVGGYTHRVHSSCANPLPGGTLCFSGSHDWEYVEANLGFYPGAAKVRFRFCSDAINGGEGWYIDDIAIRVSTAEWLDVTIDPLGDPGGGFGAAWGDYDNDGRLDIYLTNYATPNRLFHNDGGGFFGDVTSSPLDDPSNGYGVAWADYDNDGDLDLYIANNGNSNRLFENTGGSFTDATVPPLDDLGYGHCVAWADYDQDGHVDLYLSNGGANKLFRNNGGVFEDVTSGPLADAAWSEGVGWADYDNDGDLDLYLVNYNTTNKMLRNDGGSFSDVSSGPLGAAGWGKGLAWGDYDNDEDLDLYIVNEGANLLLRNDGGGTFVDVTSGLLGDDGWGRGASWIDYDNDADLDLFIANYGTGNKLLRNDDGVFADATSQPMAEADYAQGAAFADYDLDGDLDVYLAVRNNRNKLLNNNLSSGHHWLHLDLDGTTSNASAIGARVRLVSGGRSQIREVSGGSGFCTQNSLAVEFGLGQHTSADTIEIRWPSGTMDRLFDVAADTLLRIEEGVTSAGDPYTDPLDYMVYANFPNPFNPTTVIGYDLPKEQEVELRIFDVSGRLVRDLVDGMSQEAGRHLITWDGRDNYGHQVSSGVYFYRLEAGPFREARKMVLLR
jgi:hypothetical protein